MNSTQKSPPRPLPDWWRETTRRTGELCPAELVGHVGSAGSETGTWHKPEGAECCTLRGGACGRSAPQEARRPHLRHRGRAPQRPRLRPAGEGAPGPSGSRGCAHSRGAGAVSCVVMLPGRLLCAAPGAAVRLSGRSGCTRLSSASPGRTARSPGSRGPARPCISAASAWRRAGWGPGQQGAGCSQG